MRVLFVHSRMPGGGIERVTLTLIEEFQRHGIKCCLALRLARGEFMAEANALTDVIELASTGMHRFVPRLADLIQEFAPTHIVTAMPDISLLTLIARWRVASDACILQGVHLTQARIAHPEGMRGWLRSTAERTIARLVYRRLDALVAVSAGIRDELTGEFGVDAKRVSLVYNPIVRVDSIGGRVDSPGAAPRPVRFVAIGRLSRQKGFDLLVRALARVGGGWSLDIYGAGPEHDRLATLVDTCELADRIRLRGHTDDPYGAVDTADWLVMPSRFEGFGVVLVEALARGVPVIASDCPHGPAEIVDNGRFGVLVRPDDVDALAAALSEAIDGSIQFQGDDLRKRALNYSVSRSVDKWLDMLAKIDESTKEK